MNIKPIRFTANEVRATLDGRKTTKRLAIKPQPEMQRFGDHEAMAFVPPAIVNGYEAVGVRHTGYLKSPYQIGDILYVRETWCRFDCSCCEGDTITGRCLKAPDAREGCYMYRSTNEITGDARWRSPMCMPREAARIFLRVTNTRVERLQDITVDGINSEGVDVEPPPICRKGDPTESERAAFAKLTVQKQDEYISTLARHTYMGWCKYAYDLFVAWQNLWDSTIKPVDRKLYGWAANPWIWRVEFERCENPYKVAR